MDFIMFDWISMEFGGISPLMITCQNLMENQLVLVALMIISPNYGFRSLRKHMQKSTITIAVLSRLEFQDSIIYVIWLALLFVNTTRKFLII